MLIGELAARAGASVQAVRLYERRGLLRKPARTAAGYRTYRPFDLEILQTVKRCQGLGLTLAEVSRVVELLRTFDPDLPPPAAIDARACLREIEALGVEKLGKLDARMAELAGVRRDLVAALGEIRAGIERP
jgi:DNA-binding transcriptional MerR regulator